MMDKNKDNLKVYRVKDLMECLHIGKDKAYNLMRSIDFPSMQIGKTYIVTKEKFEQWLDDNTGKKIDL